VLGSFIFKSADGPAAGASGALFGLVGILFVFGLKYRRELPEGFKRVFGTGMLPIIFVNLFIGYIGRTSISNSAHLAGLLSGALLALFVDYRRPGSRATITTAWRALQVVCLMVIALGAYEVVKNFSRPIPGITRVAPNANALIFLNYINAMNQVQEKVSAVIHANDLSNLEQVTQSAMQAPVPDARAAELRLRLLNILSRLAAAAAEASPPPPENAPGRPPVLDQKLVDEYTNWRKEYDEWLKVAARTYTETP
jgi:hypothetical protein